MDVTFSSKAALNAFQSRTIDELVVKALSRFADRISAVEIRLADTNGPKGGVDQQCDLELHFEKGGRLHATAIAEKPLAAVGRAAHTLQKLVRRHVRRQRNMPRRMRQLASPRAV